MKNIFKSIKTGVTTKCGRLALKCKKYSPEIMVVAGTVGVVATIVVACKETLKVEKIVDEAGDQLFEIEDALNNHKSVKNEDGTVTVYSEQDAKHDKAIVYAKTGVKVVKNYAPAIILGLLSITLILSGTNILRKRNVALMGAYSALQKSYDTYRERVKACYGDKVDEEFMTGATRTVDEKTGVETTVMYSNGPADPFSVIWDETSSREWSTSGDYNACFLRCQERHANDMLRTRGHLFLNEVFDMLGLPRTKEGAIMGWVIGNDISHGFVSFGIEKNYADWDQYKGYGCIERSYMLKFNVDGVIYDLI